MDALSLARQELLDIDRAGLRKTPVTLSSAQGARVRLGDRSLVNMCSNDYLGLADDPRLVEAAKTALDTWGFGMASVRFICGTNELHEELERRLARFLGVEDVVLFSSCYD